MYNTNYRVIDKNGRVVFFNSSTSCFSEFNSSANPTLEYKKGNKMEIFYPLETMGDRSEINAWWLAQLLKWGMKFQYEVRNIDFVLDDQYSKSMHSYSNVKTAYGVWTLEYDDFNSKAHIKLALHLMRYVYEENMFVILLHMKKVMEENPNEEAWSMFQYASSTCKEQTGGGHLMFYAGSALNLKPDQTLFDIIERYKTAEYSQSSVSWLSNLCLCPSSRCTYQVNIQLRTATLEKYKQIINTL